MNISMWFQNWMKANMLFALLLICVSGFSQEDKKRIALTLDDGPNHELTEQFLELFEKYDIQVTFFQVGKKASQQVDLCQKILEQGHEIGNHSWSHQRLTELPSEKVNKEIIDFQKFFRDSLKYQPVSFRAPYLKRNALIDSICADNQMQIVAADVYARDAKAFVDPQDVVNNLDMDFSDGSIILCHEREHTLKALRILLPLWKMKYQFITVQQLLITNDE